MLLDNLTQTLIQCKVSDSVTYRLQASLQPQSDLQSAESVCPELGVINILVKFRQLKLPVESKGNTFKIKQCFL